MSQPSFFDLLLYSACLPMPIHNSFTKDAVVMLQFVLHGLCLVISLNRLKCELLRRNVSDLIPEAKTYLAHYNV